MACIAIRDISHRNPHWNMGITNLYQLEEGIGGVGERRLTLK